MVFTLNLSNLPSLSYRLHISVFMSQFLCRHSFLYDNYPYNVCVHRAPTSYQHSKALFKFKNFLDFDIVALSFLFDKHYPIMEQLGLKDSSRDLKINCAISYLFYLYLMFHACAVRFDVMRNLVKFWVFRCI